jgi:hypothetical protein
MPVTFPFLRAFVKHREVVIGDIDKLELSILALFRYAVHPSCNCSVVTTGSRASCYDCDFKHVTSSFSLAAPIALIIALRDLFPMEYLLKLFH